MEEGGVGESQGVEFTVKEEYGHSNTSNVPSQSQRVCMPCKGKGFWRSTHKGVFSLSLLDRWKAVCCVGSLRHSHILVTERHRYFQCFSIKADQEEESCSSWLCIVPFLDPERHLPAKSETQPELFGALPAPARLLPRVFCGGILVTYLCLGLLFPFCFLKSWAPWSCNNASYFVIHLEDRLWFLVSLTLKFQNQEDSASSNPFVLPNSVTPPLPTFARVTTAYGSYQDANIPFPRTSGARFCGAGRCFLVVWF